MIEHSVRSSGHIVCHTKGACGSVTEELFVLILFLCSFQSCGAKGSSIHICSSTAGAQGPQIRSFTRGTFSDVGQSDPPYDPPALRRVLKQWPDGTLCTLRQQHQPQKALRTTGVSHVIWSRVVKEHPLTLSVWGSRDVKPVRAGQGAHPHKGRTRHPLQDAEGCLTVCSPPQRASHGPFGTPRHGGLLHASGSWSGSTAIAGTGMCTGHPKGGGLRAFGGGGGGGSPPPPPPPWGWQMFGCLGYGCWHHRCQHFFFAFSLVLGSWAGWVGEPPLWGWTICGLGCAIFPGEVGVPNHRGAGGKGACVVSSPPPPRPPRAARGPLLATVP